MSSPQFLKAVLYSREGTLSKDSIPLPILPPLPLPVPWDQRGAASAWHWASAAPWLAVDRPLRRRPARLTPVWVAIGSIIEWLGLVEFCVSRIVVLASCDARYAKLPYSLSLHTESVSGLVAGNIALTSLLLSFFFVFPPFRRMNPSSPR